MISLKASFASWKVCKFLLRYILYVYVCVCVCIYIYIYFKTKRKEGGHRQFQLINLEMTEFKSHH